MATTTIEPITESESPPTSTPLWLRFARAGAITMVVWSIGLQLAVGAFIPPVTVVGVLFGSFVPFLRGERRKLGLAFAVVTIVALVGNLPFLIDDLANPDSAPTFIAGLFSAVAAVAGVAGGLGAFFRWSVDPIRRLAIGGVGVFVVGAAVSVGISAGTDSSTALATDTAVVALGVQWDSDVITLEPGSTGIWVDNQDGVRHTFTVPELDIDLEIPAFTAQRIDVGAVVPGEYEIICTVPGHELMTATLVVEGRES